MQVVVQIELYFRVPSILMLMPMAVQEHIEVLQCLQYSKTAPATTKLHIFDCTWNPLKAETEHK
jgi:hypothetical protein